MQARLDFLDKDKQEMKRKSKQFMEFFPELAEDEEEASEDESSLEAFFLDEDHEEVFTMFLLFRFWIKDDKLDSTLIVEYIRNKNLDFTETLQKFTYISIGYFSVRNTILYPTNGNKNGE